MGTKLTVEEQELFLNNIVEKARGLSDSIDQQMNIIVGISSAIFLYSVTQYVNGHQLVHLVLTLFTGLTILMGVVAIHPFRWMRRRRGEESIMYNRRVVKYESYKHYRRDLEEILTDRDLIVDEYTKEIYNQFRFYYRPKRDLYIHTRNVFAGGIALAALIVILGALLK